MKIEIETNKLSPALAQQKADKLQALSNVMNDDVLTLFEGIAKKADTPQKIKEFNEKVLSNKSLIESAFGGGSFIGSFFGGN
jgi:hypothetical protein